MWLRCFTRYCPVLGAPFYSTTVYLFFPFFVIQRREFRIEDAGVGILLAPLQVNRVHVPEIRPEREGAIPELCHHILQHRLTPSEFRACYEVLSGSKVEL